MVLPVKHHSERKGPFPGLRLRQCGQCCISSRPKPTRSHSRLESGGITEATGCWLRSIKLWGHKTGTHCGRRGLKLPKAWPIVLCTERLLAVVPGRAGLISPQVQLLLVTPLPRPISLQAFVLCSRSMSNHC